ncbi:glycosyltransferase [Actinopolymorpha alba]|uniref:glycosyltransferase n=1 Tax=Actinopolymorpha alba TaxID=533267 RepID=UPI00036634CB|nr:glycosyltransferase [Actinopolymorpha alba]
MRIAQLANFYAPTSGGLRTAVDALGRGYVGAGHERLLLVPGPRDSWHEDEHGLTVTFRAPYLPGTHYRVVVEPWRINDVLDRLRPTSVEVSDKATMVTAARWARRRRAGSVLLSHERLDTHLAPRIRWQAGLVTGSNAVNRYLLRTFDTVVVTSGFAAEEFTRVGAGAGSGDRAKAPARVRRIPLGVDLATFHPDRRRRGPSGDGVARLVHAGRLSYEKRPDLAIATAVELHRQGFAFQLDVYGDGPDRDALVRLAGEAPVVFHPYVADRHELAARLANADAALSLCPDETFGLAILEALACGTPVVTANRGGGRELITLASGACAEPEPSALATAVRAVLSRPEAARRLAARERAERYPWGSTVAAMLAVHASVSDEATVLTRPAAPLPWHPGVGSRADLGGR